MVNLELYRVFYTVAKCGSLTRAAEELYISQPAVSQSIKQLESQLGVSLFNRTHRGMELSAQGGKAIFAKIELLSDVTPRTLEDLKANLCDVAFVNLPIEPDPALKLYGNFMHLSEVFVTSGKYPELLNGKVSIAELEKYPLVTLEENTIATKSLKRFLSSVGVNLQSSIQTGSWEMMKQLVSKGMGIGVIPKEYMQRCLEDESLFLIDTNPALPVRSVGMVLVKDQPIPYALRAFLALFEVKV